MTQNIDATWAEQASAPDTPGTGKWKIYPKADGWYTVDDGGNEYALMSLTAAELPVMASQMWPTTTAGCAALAKTEYGTNDIDLQTLDFDQTTVEYAQFMVWMPDNWDAGTVTFKALWTAAAGTAAQTVEWNLQGRSYANDDAIDQAWGTAVEVSDALIATGDVHISAESTAVTLAGTPAAGEPVQFRAWRDADNDTLEADGKLAGLKIYYGRGA
jgi:hypothetical protein